MNSKDTRTSDDVMRQMTWAKLAAKIAKLREKLVILQDEATTSHENCLAALTRERELSLAYERMRGALTIACDWLESLDVVDEEGRPLAPALRNTASSSPSEYAKRVRDWVEWAWQYIQVTNGPRWEEGRALLSGWKGE